MSELDGAEVYRRLDPSGMGAYVEGLPEQVADAWAAAKRVELPASMRQPSQLVVLGMGGSAIGGDLLRMLAARVSPVPVRVFRGYNAPPRLDARAIVVASSNSGGTEETLSAFEQTLQTAAMPFVSTTGGRLLEIARARGIPSYVYAFPSPPRAALGHGCMPLVRLAEHAGVLPRQDEAVAEAVGVMQALRDEIAARVPEQDNRAKRMARALHGRLPIVFGAEHLAEAAHRWRCQFAENSKSWALSDELPEANHNTIVGLGLPAGVIPDVRAIFLRAASLHPRVAARYELTRQALSDAGIESDLVDGRGSGALAELFSTIHFGDYVSYYLAILNGADPTPIGPIDRFKARLAEVVPGA